MTAFLGDRKLVWSFFRLGFTIVLLELELLGQIASFERRPRGWGFNAPHPAFCVLHLDLNADRL